MRIDNKNKWWVVLFLFFTCLGIVLKLFPLPLLFGLSIQFSAFAYFVLVRIIGYKTGVIAAFFGSAIVFFIFPEDPFVFISLLEVIIIGGLYKYLKKDILTWTFLYSLVVLISFFVLTRLLDILSTVESAGMIMSIIVSVLISALFADISSEYLPYLPFFKRFPLKKQPIFFGKIISYIMVLSATVPLVLVMIFNGWLLQDEIYTDLTQDHQRLESRVLEIEEEMDSTEIQNFKLGSIVEKAHFKLTMEQAIDNEERLLYVLNDDGTFYLTIGLAEGNEAEVYDQLTSGYVSDPNEMGYFILPKNQNKIENWENGFYISTSTFLDKQIIVVTPLKENIQLVVESMRKYVAMTILVLYVALGLGMVTNRILSKSLWSLTRQTRALPNQLEKRKEFKTSTINIMEFKSLANNIEKVSIRLRSMFLEIQDKNKLLIEQTQQLKVSENKLFQLAHFDGLTALPNRYSFHLDIQKRIEKGQETGEEFAIVFIDLDHFKQVNDNIGHSGGDQLLKIFAKRLMAFERENPGIRSYRLAGDEFVAIMDLVTYTTVQENCQRLLEVVNRPIKIKHYIMELTASLGVSSFPRDGQTVDDLLHHADTAMYERKKTGKNGIQFSICKGENE
ncbi:GGDEF domain-containing protein [Saliterribacillus persicus]|uniref:Diguanylate cyclase (GGDEF)-like protein n=1 Tax=Saliterribacillus persicus TaxID=930114 RepID=A0A368XV63_9BACI|nr:GGDEF domain-containing protein [Saliterribacillus persicus]RCW71970.1 diguanylate cyclase (GGDEF)-like protein [Saliterribacillus persicus]